MVVQGILWILYGLLLQPEPGTATLPLLMESVIQALAELEQKAPATEAGHTASAWLLSAQDSCAHNPLHHFLLEGQNLKTTKLDPPSLSPELQGLTVEVARHDAGVTFPDIGATVPDVRATSPGLRDTSSDVTCADVGAVSPNVIATDLDVGATSPDVRPGSPHVQVTSPDVQASSADTKANFPTTVDSLLVVTLARDLGLNFLQGPQTWSHSLGTEGCWDQLSVPRTFTLLDPEASTLTTAFLNGALDGALLGDYLSRLPEPRPPLSRLLSQYYGAGVAGDPGFRSNFRRQNGAALTPTPILTQQVWGALILLQRLEPAHPQLQGMSQEQLAQVATHATKEFTEAFLGCPAIHPRCRWGAAPYRGRPTPLQLPLGFLYVHHTYVPAPPCTDFERCATDMRSMQRFHQHTRGWDDIGYSFVVGSDGYVYEGRGWHWVGAHTLGHNSRGFGVALIGNYTAELPAEAALRAVRDELPRCAVRAGVLRPGYALLGHRQLVRTDCPGDALFNLLRTWPHFDKNVKPRTARRATRRSRRRPPPTILLATDLQ
ncbi:N-acetylmuramoyl-L-alanine amidase isoform X2 [Eubalaena glacialis]|uniref:N-acetylmuramoyl-L-alanine amidase isoform X2 n=1 Tax=Eubalaena glacialis TaxID=27606 RepID=UPI002A5A8A09|nr:N-acetylmuramoyl-L-alanine amidase isoform X2 [Eubalaena glacialis]